MQVWKIEDFLAKWTKATAGKSDDPIAIILTNEIDNYTLCLPHLKSSLRGAGWEDSHWGQLFGMIGIKTTGPAAVSKENVTLTHFLEKAEAVRARGGGRRRGLGGGGGLDIKNRNG